MRLKEGKLFLIKVLKIIFSDLIKPFPFTNFKTMKEIEKKENISSKEECLDEVIPKPPISEDKEECLDEVIPKTTSNKDGDEDISE